MSSTSRGGQRSPADEYPTPPWALTRLLEFWEALGRMPWLAQDMGVRQRWLECAAGDGVLVRTLREYVAGRAGELAVAVQPVIDVVELRPEMADKLSLGLSGPGEVHCPQDFLTWDPAGRYDVVFTNPPFSLAEAFLHKALQVTKRHVFLLLRHNWIESRARHALFRRCMPTSEFVLPDRPPFIRNPEGVWVTDSISYGWFHWDLDDLNPPYTKMYLLDLTPKKVRRP